jgi:hypothetical protein
MKRVTQQHTRNNFVQPAANLPQQQVRNFIPPAAFNFAQPNRIQQNLKREMPVRQNFRREIAKIAPATPAPDLIDKIKIFMNSDSNFYLGFGGLGDALLLLATCWNDSKAKIVYFANYIPFVKQFFELFNKPVYLEKNIMGTQTAGQIFELMVHNPKFRQSAHLADGLYFGDWKNEDKYIQRIKGHVPWKEMLGTFKTNKPILVLCPSGSHRDENRQRYITQEEYKSLANKSLDEGYEVFVSGSLSDLHYYSIINRESFHWMTAENIYNWNGTIENSNLKKMLQIINGASKVISMDTWLKTYALLCNIETVVIQTRWQGKYLEYGADVTDWIFLNNKIWPNLKIEPVENLL